MKKMNYRNNNGITLIALVITIVVLIILSAVSINIIFNDNGIISRAGSAQKKMDDAADKEIESVNSLNNLINKKTGEEENIPEETKNVADMVGETADKNESAKDLYGNKIMIPKGFKIVPHGSTGNVTYNYTETEDHIPSVQDGIVIEDTREATLGNQFVWVPVGSIKNKDGSTTNITLGRYTFENASEPALQQPKDDSTYESTLKVAQYYTELAISRNGNDKTDASSENATALHLTQFTSNATKNGGYYIARFEASGTKEKIVSKYNQEVLTGITQLEAATSARKMYQGVDSHYESDLANSYAWDTAIVFIQKYSGNSNYASENNGKAFGNTGSAENADKYCNIWDMSGNAREWTTETSSVNLFNTYLVCTCRGGYYNNSKVNGNSSHRDSLRNKIYRSNMWLTCNTLCYLEKLFKKLKIHIIYNVFTIRC